MSQIQNGQDRVVAYASKVLSKSERKYCVTVKKLLAVVTFIKHFRHFLYGRKFLVKIDNSFLPWLPWFKKGSWFDSSRLFRNMIWISSIDQGDCMDFLALNGWEKPEVQEDYARTLEKEINFVY